MYLERIGKRIKTQKRSQQALQLPRGTYKIKPLIFKRFLNEIRIVFPLIVVTGFVDVFVAVFVGVFVDVFVDVFVAVFVAVFCF